MEDKEKINTHAAAGEAAAQPEEGQEQQVVYKNAKERFYDKIPLSVKHLNIIIAILIIALVTVLVIGTLLGNGIIGGT